MVESKETKQRVLVGRVVSAKMEKTIVVQFDRSFRHPQLHKIVRTSKKYKVHDPNSAAKVGDLVEFYEGRPVSKTKYMYLARVI